jgi:hypothetical protein
MSLINDAYLTCEQQAIIDIITREGPVYVMRIERFMQAVYNMNKRDVHKWLSILFEADMIEIAPHGGFRLNRDRR